MIDPSHAETAWRRRGFSFMTHEFKPYCHWKNTIHDVDELFMLARGEMELYISGKRVYPKPGEVVFIPAGAVRSKRVLSASGAISYLGYRRQ